MLWCWRLLLSGRRRRRRRHHRTLAPLARVRRSCRALLGALDDAGSRLRVRGAVRISFIDSLRID